MASPVGENDNRSRLLFARPWTFLLSVADLSGLPAFGGVEVAFAGRSNVGKSSLINALTGHGGLARTSNTPGRTQQLNYFVPESHEAALLALVDMPGYGYAKAPKAQVEAWTDLVMAYLKGRANLRRVYVLIDSRHGLKANDLEVLDMLDRTAVSYQIVLTKADKVKPGPLDDTIQMVRRALQKRPAAFPELLVTSSEKSTGLDDLRQAIADVAAT